MNRFQLRFGTDERGQALVIVALFLSFVFLAFAALAIDGTIIYLRRRQLQNAADAAALAAATLLTQNKDVAAAYQAAMDTVAANDGRIDWYSTSATPNPPSTNVGAGANMTMGIEITDACEVRVALQWSDIGTYFAQFVGRSQLQVGANAHAGCNRAGGVQPIAVKRFGDERDWNISLNNINNATVYCDDCSTQDELAAQGYGSATDFLRPSGTDTLNTWPGWPDPGGIFLSPSPHADMAAGAPGREYFFLGSGVVPNVGTTSYAGLINLDIRHLYDRPIEEISYYNSVSGGTNSNTLKDLGEYYIRRGYCCDIPRVGDQVAMYNGGSTAFAAHAFQQSYRVGDVVSVIVYDGTIFRAPNLVLTGEDPNFKHTYVTTATAASSPLVYTLNLTAEDGFVSSPQGVTMNVEGLSGFANWKFSPTSSPVLGAGVTNRTLTLAITPTTTTAGGVTQVVTGTRMFYVSAIDNKTGGSGVRRYWAGIATVGDIVGGVQRNLPAVTGTPRALSNYPYIAIVKGDPSTTIRLDLDVWGINTDQDITVISGALPAGFSWNGAPPWTKTNVKWDRHPGVSFNIRLQVGSAATASSTPYAIPLTVSAPGISTQSFNLYVLVLNAKSDLKDFVRILGYAALEITGYYNSSNLIDPTSPTPANAVRGRIVSELMTDPSQLTFGMRARLIPWEQ